MEASFAPNRKHYPNLILDMKFMTPLTLEKLKVPMQVYIEGNISAGKSELLKHFEEKTNVITIPEPLTSGKTSLEQIYLNSNMKIMRNLNSCSKILLI